MLETPTIAKSAYASSTLSNLDQPFNGFQGAVGFGHREPDQKHDLLKAALVQQLQQQPKKEHKAMPTARIVKVYIADSNENLPLDKRVLYTGSEKLTDMTDQELFFEVPIADLLKKHNEVRAATVDKKQSEKFGRDIFLEPARIRDLKMVVVDVASF